MTYINPNLSGVDAPSFKDTAQSLLTNGSEIAKDMGDLIYQMGSGYELNADTSGNLRDKDNKTIYKTTNSDGTTVYATADAKPAGGSACKSEDIKGVMEAAKKNPPLVNLKKMAAEDYMVNQMELGQLTSSFEAVNGANTMNDQKVSDSAKKVEQGAR